MRVTVDPTRPLAEEPRTGHNRWHPDLEPIATVRPDEEITLETRDGIDGQLTPANTADDIRSSTSDPDGNTYGLGLVSEH